MKTKKTIAAIAALMVAVSSLNSLPLAVSADTEDNVPASVETTAEPESTEETGVTDDSSTSADNEAYVTDTNTDITDNMTGASQDDVNTPAQSELSAVITPEAYDALTDEEKEQYACIGTMDNMFVTYLKPGEQVGTTIPFGSFVKKGTEVYFAVPPQNFHGDILVWGSLDASGNETDNAAYLTYNGVDAWGYSHVIGENDTVVAAGTVGATKGIVSPDEYSGYVPALKAYYTKINVDSPAYVYMYGLDGAGYEIADGNYVLKNMNIRIGMYREDYMDNDILINGEVANATSSGGTENFGVEHTVGAAESAITVTTQPTVSEKTTVRFDGNGVYAMYYVDDWTGGGYIGNGEKVRVGTPLLIGAYKNLAAGCDILVNGEVLPLHLNGDGTHMIAGYIPDSEEIVITRVKRDTLTDYEKENYVPAYFGSDIEVLEFPWSSGDYGDEDHVIFKSGCIIARGTTLSIAVKPEKYAGKVLKINGNTVNLTANGDNSAYIGDYVIPSNVSSLSITLETTPVIPSTPSRPSAPPITPVISTPTLTEGTDLSTSENAGNIPSETETLKIVGRSHKSSITYNAAQAGVTEDILKAFSDNRYAKTLTAKFDRFKVKIDKTDIEDVNELKDIDLSISEKTVISQTQIKKLRSLKNSKKIVQLNFNSSEDIGSLKEIGIQANVGKKLSGETAVIYERKGKKLVKVGSAKVKVNGYVCFDTDHLGQFVVAIR